VLFTDRKLHAAFRSVLKSVTLSDLERPNDGNYTLFHTTRQPSEPTVSNSLKLDPYCQRQKSLKIPAGSLVLAIIWFMGLSLRVISAVAELTHKNLRIVQNRIESFISGNKAHSAQ